MDAEIAAAAEGYVRRTGRSAAVPSGKSARQRSPCPGSDRGYCSRFGLFVAGDLCARCRSSERQRRSEPSQLMRLASMYARLSAPRCERRSPVLGVRSGCGCREGVAKQVVFICSRDGRKITPVNCVLCIARNGGG